MPKLFTRLAALIIAIGLFATQAVSAFACGGLVAPDGDVRLGRATTLVAWHDGIERYMTSFSYQGDASNLGWIVPLPAVPLKIEAGGAWTLQRLQREAEPPRFDVFSATAPSAAGSAQVLEQVKVEALNITVIRGSGQEILNWAAGNGFSVDGDTRAHLLVYAQGSPIFMAAKYDVSAAKARHQQQGDGAPVLITMKTAHPWIPFEVLALDGQQVQADLFLLTDTPVNTSDLNVKLGQSAVGQEIPGAPGFKVVFQEKMNDLLYHDLSTDRNMGWVPRESWYTYLNLDAPDTAVTYDMGISSNGVIRLAPFGTPPMAVVDGKKAQAQELPGWLPSLPVGSSPFLYGLGGLLVVGASGFAFLRWRRRRSRGVEIAV
ncbi:MAG TPA: DUF2330 domain-containing protein [Ktedonosporobacter sp.]|nr:DUF2330 domain-containing protein [Ktedonosporobacter sp.]